MRYHPKNLLTCFGKKNPLLSTKKSRYKPSKKLSKYGIWVFPKIGVPPIFHYKSSILGGFPPILGNNHIFLQQFWGSPGASSRHLPDRYKPNPTLPATQLADPWGQDFREFSGGGDFSTNVYFKMKAISQDLG